MHGDTDKPLCVDLDGTLVRTDTLAEAVIASFRNLGVSLRMPVWLLRGRAFFKAKLAGLNTVDPSLLPYNERAVEYLRTQARSGRRLVLATAAHRLIAEAVSEYLGLFSEVLASSEATNLKGKTKAEALVARFGEGGFTYMGNDSSDLEVWKHASGAVLVNVSRRVARKAERLARVEARIEDDVSKSKAFLKAVRPHQWVKNILVFIPVLAAGAFRDVKAMLAATVLFVAFSAIASGLYLVNDLFDLTADRMHPSKKKRPFASGALPIGIGMVAAPLLVIGGILLGSLLSFREAVLPLMCYALLSALYSARLKKYPLVDVFALAALYTLRLFAGGEATGYGVSFWLLAFSGFIFLALAVVKRTSELMALAKAGGRATQRRGYTTDDIPVLKMFGISSSFISSLVIALYIHDQASTRIYATPKALWFMVPLLLLWQCRLWLSTERGDMLDDPIVFSVKDRVSWIIGVFAVIVVVAAHTRF